MADIISTLSFTGDKGTPSGGGAFYTSMSAWAAAQAQDLTVGNTAILECYGDFVGGLDDRVDLAGFTTDNTNRVIIRAAPGEEIVYQNGSVVSGFYLNYSGASSDGVISLDCDVTLQDIGVFSATQWGTIQNSFANNQDVLVERCACVNTNTSGDNGRAIRFGVNFGSGNCTIRNTIAVSSNNSGANCYAAFIASPNAGQFVLFESCSLFNEFGGAVQGGDTTRTQFDNTIAYSDAAGGGWGITAGSNVGSNASNGTAVPGANPQTLLTNADFVDYPNGDYTPADSGKLDGNGADLSGTFTDDFYRETRTLPWDIGAIAITAVVDTADTNAFTITIAAASTPISFDGNIADISGVEGIAITPVDVSGEFSGTETPFTYQKVGAWPSWANLDPNTGVISGTPDTDGTTANLRVQGTDQDTNTAQSNLFSFIISEPSTTTVIESDTQDSSTYLTGTSSVTNPESLTPVIDLRGWNQGENAGWHMVYATISGVAGKTPTFETSFVDYRIANKLPDSAGRTTWGMLYRYPRVDNSDPWKLFDNADRNFNPHNYSNNSAFTENVIEVASYPRHDYGVDSLGLLSTLDASPYSYELPSSIAAPSLPKHVHLNSNPALTPRNNYPIGNCYQWGIGMEDTSSQPDKAYLEKLNLIIVLAQHAQEDQGDQMGEEILKLFMDSGSPEGAILRKNTRLFVYKVNMSGRLYGSQRYTNADSVRRDPNRNWHAAGASSEVNAAKAAFAADIGGKIDVIWDLHSHGELGANLVAQHGDYATSNPIDTKWSNLLQTNLGETIHNFGGIATESLQEQGYIQFGAQLSMTQEVGYGNTGFPDPAAMYGPLAVAMVQTLDDLIQSGDIRPSLKSGESITFPMDEGTGDTINSDTAGVSGSWNDALDWQVKGDNSRRYPCNEGTGATLNAFDGNGDDNDPADATIQNFDEANWS